jgi:hypothetical protein
LIVDTLLYSISSKIGHVEYFIVTRFEIS